MPEMRGRFILVCPKQGLNLFYKQVKQGTVARLTL